MKAGGSKKNWPLHQAMEALLMEVIAIAAVLATVLAAGGDHALLLAYEKVDAVARARLPSPIGSRE